MKKLFLLVLVSACSTTPAKKFSSTNVHNLTIVTHSNATHISQMLYFTVSEYYPECQYRVLGDIDVKVNEKFSTGIPIGNYIRIFTEYKTSGFLSGTNSHFFSLILRPEKSKNYELEFLEHDGSIGSSIFEVNGSSRKEVETPLMKKCNSYIELQS